jgi:hypothetical protein
MAALAVPSFPAGSFSNASAAQSHQSQPRSSQMPRNLYSNAVTGLPPPNYRGGPPSTIAPYAFSSTSQQQQKQQQPSYLRPENRSMSASQAQQSYSNANAPRQRYPQNPSTSTTSTSSSNTSSAGQMSRDDMSMPLQRGPVSQTRPAPISTLSNSSTSMNNGALSSKPSPDRYRRVPRRAETGPAGSGGLGSAPPSGSGMATVGHLYNHPNRASGSPSLHSYNNLSGSAPVLNRPQSMGPNFGSFQSDAGQMRSSSVDDMQMPRHPAPFQPDRYRRKSVSSLDAGENTAGHVDMGPSVMPNFRPVSTIPDEMPRNIMGSQRPPSRHSQSDSSESVRSARSGNEPAPSVSVSTAITSGRVLII